MKMNSPVNRLIGDMPKVGIRPTIDGRRKGVRESLETTTMGMAKGRFFQRKIGCRQEKALQTQPRKPGGIRRLESADNGRKVMRAGQDLMSGF